jgi:plastocyanin
MSTHRFAALLLAAALACTSSSSPPAPPSGPGPANNGCTIFTDASAAASTRTISFAGNQYSPGCLTIAPGQSVTFTGDFTKHPLRPGVAPSLGGGQGTTPNPIPTQTTSGTALTVTFPVAGTYPFYCAVHQSEGQTGAVQVH